MGNVRGIWQKRSGEKRAARASGDRGAPSITVEKLAQTGEERGRATTDGHRPYRR